MQKRQRLKRRYMEAASKCTASSNIQGSRVHAMKPTSPNNRGCKCWVSGVKSYLQEKKYLLSLSFCTSKSPFSGMSGNVSGSHIDILCTCVLRTLYFDCVSWTK